MLNVVSVGGLRPGPFIGAYNVSKAALIHLTRQLAQELAPGVRVNAIAPALVKTDMARALWEPNEEAMARSHALGRLGVPDDIASGALFLDLRRVVVDDRRGARRRRRRRRQLPRLTDALQQLQATGPGARFTPTAWRRVRG